MKGRIPLQGFPVNPKKLFRMVIQIWTASELNMQLKIHNLLQRKVLGQHHFIL